MRLLEHHISFDPGEPLEQWLRHIPAAWCVYLLADSQRRPIQLLCVKNLRASLKRRLSGQADQDVALPSRRVDYRAVVREVSWSRVDSAFEQDVVYLEAARRAFPESYAGVLGFPAAWWVRVDPAAQHSRFVRTTEPGGAAARFFGPIADKNAAQKLVHAVEDLFDLCRDPAALAAAPAGPCQWRQMSKCVGPCDGSVSLSAYRALVDHAADVLADVGRAIEAHQLRMRQAATARDYEAAGRIKSFIDKLEPLREGSFKHVRPLEDFRYLAVMPGRGKDSAKLFAICPGEIAPLACLRESPTKGRGEEVLRVALEALVVPAPAIESAAQRERLSLVTQHLFPSRKTPGVFIPLMDLQDKTLAAAFREVNRPWKRPESEPDEEGEVRGLQAL